MTQERLEAIRLLHAKSLGRMDAERAFALRSAVGDLLAEVNRQRVLLWLKGVR